MDGIESDGHSHEEKGTISILDTLKSTITVLEENDSEESSDNGNYKLDVGGLRKTNGVQEVSLDQETKLVAPADLILIVIIILNRRNLVADFLMIISEVGVLIVLMEVFNNVGVVLENFGLSLSWLTILNIVKLLTLN